MSPSLRRLMVSLACVLVVAAAGAVGVAAQGDTRCFPETGQCITGVIKQYWERNGGLPVFGYPITPLRSEAVEGWSGPVQWFERDRLEDHTGEGKGVLAGRLGVERLAQQGRPWQFRPLGGPVQGCRGFPETGYYLCGGFLSYWERNGGLERFGFPITDQIVENLGGRDFTVQYFERRRMEYHPENRPPFEILLGLLGNELRGGGAPAPTATFIPAVPSPTPTRGPGDEGVASSLSLPNNGEFVCRIDTGVVFTPGVADVGNLGTLESPCQFELRFSGYRAGQQLTIAIRSPSGGDYAERTVPVVETGQSRWRPEFLLGAPEGRYLVEVYPDSGGVQRGTVGVTRPSAPRALVLPTAVDSRDTIRFYGSGLPGGSSLPVYVYRFRDRGRPQADYLRRIGTLRADGRGEGEVQFQLRAEDGSALYAAGYFVPNVAGNPNNCIDDPLDPRRDFCYETFEFNP